MTIEEQRQKVIQAAESWMGTPFHHEACVKGAGADCVSMPANCYNEVEMSIVVPQHSPQWHLHQKKDGEGKEYFHELYLEHLILQGFVEISDNRPNNKPFNPDHYIEAPKQPGDFVVTKLARVYAHGAIIVEWPWVIQTESSPMGRGKVVKANVDANWFFTGRQLKFFSPKIWH